MALIYYFEWNADKARGNRQKHGISFQQASTVFHDQLAVTIFDADHGDDEERWVTIGQASGGQTLVVIHTFTALNQSEAKVRLISARRADRQETKDYEETPH